MIANHLAALRGLVCMGLLLTLNAPLAYAQLSSAGTFSGLVTDQQGAAVADAAVLLLDTSTNTTQRTVTNEAGRYFFLNVAPGIYDLSVNKTGFNAAKLTGQRLQVGGVVTLDVTLQVGSVSTTVDVTGQAVEVQTTTAAVERTVNGPLLLSLPNLGRDANAFVTLQPAVAPGRRDGGKGERPERVHGRWRKHFQRSGWQLPQLHGFERLHGHRLRRRSFRRRAHAGRKRRGVQSQPQQPDRGFQRRRRRPGADGHQARNQQVPRRGV